MAKSHYLCAASSFALALLVGGAAQAQDRSEAAAEVDEVVVTGSFIAGTPEDAALPVEVISLQDLRDQGSPTNVDLVKTLTEVGANWGEFSRLNQNQPQGSASINLRALTADRTVVLLNGRRFAEQLLTNGRFNNINQIPNAAIGRVEVLKDGGAVTYGADAVAGVVNYITRKNFTGLELNASYRLIDGSDGDYDASALWGHAWDRGNVMVSAGYQRRSELRALERDWAVRDYLEQDSVFAWAVGGSPGSYIVRNAAGTAQIPTGRQAGATGVIRDRYCTELGGFAGFSSTGSPICYYHVTNFEALAEDQEIYQVYGEANFEITPNLKFHQEAYYYYQELPEINISPSDAPVSFPMATGLYSTPGTNPAVAQFLANYNNPLTGGTAFSAAQIAAITSGGRVDLTSAGTSVWRPWGAGGNPLTGGEGQQRNTSEVIRVTSELEISLPEFGFMKESSLKLAGTFSNTKYQIRLTDVLVDRLNAALNGLGGAACNGIRADLAGSTCQYFNPFSSGVAGNVPLGLPNPGFVSTGTFAGYAPGQGLQNSLDLVNWLTVPIGLNRDSDFLVLSAVYSGQTTFELPGGPVGVAIGAQHRYMHEVNDIDDLSNRGLFSGGVQGPGNPCPTIGVLVCTSRTGVLAFGRGPANLGASRDTDREYPAYSGFVELQLPILDNVNVQLAGRYEKFIADAAGSNQDIFVPAGSIKWDVTDNLALRATAGKTFSYEDPGEGNLLQTTATTATLTTFGNVAGATTSTYDNLNIKSEVGFNFNVGAIVSLGGFRATVDYYDITIDDYVRDMTANRLVGGVVVAGQTGSAAQINCSSPLLTVDPELGVAPVILSGACVQGTSTVGNSLGAGSRLNSFNFINSGKLKTSGIDASADYRTQALGGDMTFSANVSYVLNYEASPLILGGNEVSPGFEGVGSRNQAAFKNLQVVPEWRGVFAINYSRGRHNLNLSTRYTSSLIEDRADQFTATIARNANIGDANGTTIACTGALIVNGDAPANAGTATNGARQASCDAMIMNGLKVDEQFMTDLSYRVNLPWDTSLSVTVYNVFDLDPPFARSNLSYDPNVGSPLGRNFKFAISKRF